MVPCIPIYKFTQHLHYSTCTQWNYLGLSEHVLPQNPLAQTPILVISSFPSFGIPFVWNERQLINHAYLHTQWGKTGALPNLQTMVSQLSHHFHAWRPCFTEVPKIYRLSAEFCPRKSAWSKNDDILALILILISIWYWYWWIWYPYVFKCLCPSKPWCGWRNHLVNWLGSREHLQERRFSMFFPLIMGVSNVPSNSASYAVIWYTHWSSNDGNGNFYHLWRTLPFNPPFTGDVQLTHPPTPQRHILKVQGDVQFSQRFAKLPCDHLQSYTV